MSTQDPATKDPDASPWPDPNVPVEPVHSETEPEPDDPAQKH
jgi:hypothetical protein